MVKLLSALLAALAVASCSAQLLGGPPRAPPAAGAGQVNLVVLLDPLQTSNSQQ